jgi:hypothetical protein
MPFGMPPLGNIEFWAEALDEKIAITAKVANTLRQNRRNCTIAISFESAVLYEHDRPPLPASQGCVPLVKHFGEMPLISEFDARSLFRSIRTAFPNPT